LVDSIVIRAHPCAACASAKQGGQLAQVLGRSCGGFSTKIHMVVDALRYPLDFVLTAGQARKFLFPDFMELHRFDQPTLCVIILRWPGDEHKVLFCNFMGIHKATIALLLDSVGIVA